MDASALQTALDLLGADAAHIAVYARAVPSIQSDKVLYRRMPDDALAAAQELFAVLRDFDARGARLIWIENPPAGAAWDGVRDRLARAAAAPHRSAGAGGRRAGERRPASRATSRRDGAAGGRPPGGRRDRHDDLRLGAGHA